MVVKVKEKLQKSRPVKNTKKSEKYNLGGERNVRYHERTLPNKNKSCNFT